MFYLDYYAQIPARNMDEQYERLLKVQNRIHEYQRDKCGNDGVYSDLLLCNKEVKHAPEQQVKVLLYAEKVSWNIDEEIEKYRSYIKSVGKDTKKSDMTTYLTDFGQMMYEFCETEDQFREFLEMGRYFIFQKRYGYLRKTKQFFLQEKGYQKNYRRITTELTREEWRAEDDWVDDVQMAAAYNKKIDEKKQIFQASGRIRKVWDLKNVLEGSSLIDICSVADRIGLHTVLDMFYGRDQLKESKYTISEQLQNRNTAQAYEFWLGSKVQVARLCIAAGFEDELPGYLMLAGYWKRDWYSNSSELERCDKTDSLIIYALHYRDALIAHYVKMWAQKNPGRSVEKFGNDLKQQFPMVGLLMSINRDIQFVLKDILKLKDSFFPDCSNLQYAYHISDTSSSFRWMGRRIAYVGMLSAVLDHYSGLVVLSMGHCC